MGERLLARPRDARALESAVCCEHSALFECKGVQAPGRRLGGAKVRMRSVSVRVWMDPPVTTGVMLNMMHFDC